MSYEDYYEQQTGKDNGSCHDTEQASQAPICPVLILDASGLNQSGVATMIHKGTKITGKKLRSFRIM
jgi:hypothetical protein